MVRDLFYHPAAIRDLAALASGLQEADGEVRAAAFRDRTGLGRKRAIQILEFFDRVGFTRRVHDKHIVRTDNLLALPVPSGAASAKRRDGRERCLTLELRKRIVPGGAAGLQTRLEALCASGWVRLPFSSANISAAVRAMRGRRRMQSPCRRSGAGS